MLIILYASLHHIYLYKIFIDKPNKYLFCFFVLYFVFLNFDFIYILFARLNENSRCIMRNT